MSAWRPVDYRRERADMSIVAQKRLGPGWRWGIAGRSDLYGVRFGLAPTARQAMRAADRAVDELLGQERRKP